MPIQRKASGKSGGAGKAVGGKTLVVPVQSTVIPPKGSGWGCKYCTYAQWAEEGTALHAKKAAWKGKAKPQIKHVISSPKIKASGPANAKVMLVGEAPGAEEDNKGKPFIGPSGTALNAYLQSSGIRREDLYVTNVVKCRPPNNATPKPSEYVHCSCYLAKEILQVKPEVIVACGATAFKVISGSSSAKITEANGTPIRMKVAGHECVVFPVWHPAYIFRNDYLAPEYKKTFEKLAEVINASSDVQADDGNYEVVTCPKRAVKILKHFSSLSKDTLVAFDFETSGLKAYLKKQRVACISLAESENKGYAIPLYAYRNADKFSPELKELGWTSEDYKRVRYWTKKFLTSPCSKEGHNVKFDMHWAHVLGVKEVTNVRRDTMLMHYACDENITHALKPLALKYTNMGAYDDKLDIEVAKTRRHPRNDSEERHGSKLVKDVRYDLVPWRILGKYAAMDAVATYRIDSAVYKELCAQGEDTKRVALRVLPRASNFLQRMEANGIFIDVEYTRRLRASLQRRVEDLNQRLLAHPVVRKFIREQTEEKIRDKKKFKFTAASTKQKELLFYSPKYLGHKKNPDKVTATGQYQVDGEMLRMFVADKNCPVASIVIELSLVNKLLSTYVSNLYDLAKRYYNGKPFINGNFNLHSTKTGRLSAASPGLQQIPTKGAGVVKRMFSSRYGEEGCIVQADYSQIELRLTAAISGDANMKNIYIKGKDIHTHTCCAVYDMTEKEYYAWEKDPKKKDELKLRRTVAKRVNFGVVYGIGAPGIVDLLRKEGIIITKKQAQTYIDKFFAAYPGVRRWIDKTHRDLERDGKVITNYRRYRRLPPIFSADHELQARARRQGTNDLVQSPASDTMLTALIIIERMLLKAGLKAKVIITVHDSVIVDCHRDCAHQVLSIIKKVMNNIHRYVPHVWGDEIDTAFLRRVPVRADLELGLNWRDVVSADPDDENFLVDATLEESRKIMDMHDSDVDSDTAFTETFRRMTM